MWLIYIQITKPKQEIFTKVRWLIVCISCFNFQVVFNAKNCFWNFVLFFFVLLCNKKSFQWFENIILVYHEFDNNNKIRITIRNNQYCIDNIDQFYMNELKLIPRWKLFFSVTIERPRVHTQNAICLKLLANFTVNRITDFCFAVQFKRKPKRTTLQSFT